MILLAIDTSGISGSAAVLQDQKILSETFWRAQASHSSELPLQVQKICRDTGLSMPQVEAFAVTLGPGSFTGLRVGLAFVKGLAFSGRKPVAGISTLEALAFPVQEEILLCPLLDARRDEVYGTLFERRGEELSSLLPEQASPPSFFLEEVRKATQDRKGSVGFLGSGARLYEKVILQALGNRVLLLDPSRDAIRARAVGLLAQVLLKKGEFSHGGMDLQPRYLRVSSPELHIMTNS